MAVIGRSAVKRSPLLLRWQATFLIMSLIVGVINYLDRSTLSVGNPLIRGDLHLSVAQMGVLLSAFSWSYALLLIPSGGLADRFGPRGWLALGLAVWSVAQMVSGTVVSFAQFIVLRVFLGAGESPCFPSFNRATTDWFHAKQRALATGVWVSSSSLGPAISLPILTFVMLAIGWRGMFIVMGVVGLIMAGIWYAIYRDPSKTKVTSEERQALAADDEPRTSAVTWRMWVQLFKYPATWGLIGGFFGAVYLGWLYLTWLPGYLESARHMSIATSGLVASIPFWAGFIGYLVGGVVSHQLGKLGWSPMTSSKVPVVVGLVGMAVFTVPAAFTSSSTLAVVFIAIAVFFQSWPGGMAWALATSVAPPNYAASLGSIQDFGGYVGGSIAPAVTGLIVAATGSFVPALVLGAVICIVSAALYLLMVRQPISGDKLEAQVSA